MRDSSERGFTLLDLLVTLTVVALLGAATLPSVVNTMQSMRRSMAVRQVLTDLRQVQSLSVSRSGVYGLQWGPSQGRASGEYRIVRDSNCSLPAANAPEDGVDVVHTWFDLSTEYPTISIRSVRDRDGQPLGAILFDPMGASVNPCGSISYPLTLEVADASGNTNAIEVGKSGFARRQ